MKHKSKKTRQASDLSPSNLNEECTTALRSNVSDNQEVKGDLRFFAYAKATQKKGVPRSKERAPTVDGSYIYRLLNNLCDHFNNPSECKDCSEGAKSIELSNITGYQTGETIIGKLTLYGWVVLLGVEFSDEVNMKIRAIANKGKWSSISTEKNRQMKYNSNSTTPRTWNDIELIQLQTGIHKKMLSILLPSTHSFQISKLNLLRNAGFFENDQDAHYDYSPRLIK